MSFSIGLSGLQAAAKDLEVTGNNVANSGTIGFKKSRAEFADIYASSFYSCVNKSAVGVRLAAVTQQFSQGNVELTGNTLDLAINGEGFFVLNSEAGQDGKVYTRNGAFQVDRDGYVVSSSGQRLQAYPPTTPNSAVSTFDTGKMEDIQLPLDNMAPKSTTEAALQANLNSDEEVITGTTPPGPAFAFPLAPDADAATVAAANAAMTAAADASAASAAVAAAAATAAATATATAADVVAAANAAATAAGADPATNAAAVAAVAAAADPTNDAAAVAAAAAAAAAADAVAASAATAAATFGTDVNPESYNWSTTYQVYDSLGKPRDVTMYFVKTGPDAWNVYAGMRDANGVMTDVGGGANPHTFATTGEHLTGGPIAIDTTPLLDPTLNVFPDNGAGLLTFTIDTANSTQYHNSRNNLNDITQDGYTSGTLTGFEVDNDGVIFSRYSNGKSYVIGQVAMANFKNSQGLQKLGDNDWGESYASGEPIYGAAGDGRLGSIQSCALENSNVDLSEELVNMITAQRAYEANAKTISTADQMTQTILNIR